MEDNKNKKNPTAFIKVVASGANPYKDRILELSILYYDGSPGPPKVINRRFNPKIDVSKEILEKNNLIDFDFSTVPAFDEKSKGLIDFFKDCDFVGYGIRNFDLPFLVEEFNRAGDAFPLYNRNIVDLETMYNTLNPRSFEAALNQYNVTQTSEANHLKISSDLFVAMLKEHKGEELNGVKITSDKKDLNTLFNPMENALDCAGKIIKNSDGRPIFNFGSKHKGELVADVVKSDSEYIQWILTSAKELPLDTIHTIKKIVAKVNK